MSTFLKVGVFLALLAMFNVIFWGGIIWATLAALRFFGVL